MSVATTSATTARDEVAVDVVDGVGRLTLDRPRQRNAISAAMFGQLRAAFAALNADDRVRVLVLRSGVDGMFCAGADIQTLADPDRDALRREFQLLVHCIADLRAVQKPVVAAVAGMCIGAGCALAAAADIVLAADDAQFCLPEVRLDLAPVLAMQALFPVVHARPLLLWSATGRMFSARDAMDGGLVTQVVPAEALAATLATLVGELRRPAAATLRHWKRAAALVASPSTPAAQQELMETMLAAATSPEARTAIAGFLDRKRDRPT